MDSKEKTLRVLKIMMDTDKDSPANAADVIKRLDNEYGVSGANRSGIYSDFALFERCGFPLREAENKSLGKYMEHDFSDAELKIMMDSVRSAKCLNSEDTAGVVKKLKDLSSARGRKKLSGMVIPREKNKTEDRDAEEYLELILEAAYQGKEIEFQYTMFDKKMNRVLRKEGRYYSFSVFSLSWNNNTYYLIGMDKKHRQLGNYRLDRIVNLKISKDDALLPEEMLGAEYYSKVQNYIDENVYHYGGEPVRLVLECAPNQRELDVLYDFAGKDIRITEVSEDIVRVSFEKRKSEALISWLMQYAHMYKVVGPEDVKGEFLVRVRAIYEKYVGDGMEK